MCAIQISFNIKNNIVNNHNHIHDHHDHRHETGDIGILERDLDPQAIKPPVRYAVWLLNDDYTPMDFVVAVLEQIFNKHAEEAFAIMMKVHDEGRAIAGIYTQDIAKTRVAQVILAAREHEHPLRCIAEPVES